MKRNRSGLPVVARAFFCVFAACQSRAWAWVARVFVDISARYVGCVRQNAKKRNQNASRNAANAQC